MSRASAAALTGLLAVLAPLSGCGTTDGQAGSAALDQLSADCLAGTTIGGSGASSVEGQDGGTSLGKPVAARLTMLFPVPAGGTGAALAEAGQKAVGCGWTGFVTDPAPGGAVLYEKQLGDARAQAALSTQDAAGGPTLVISLTLPGN